MKVGDEAGRAARGPEDPAHCCTVEIVPGSITPLLEHTLVALDHELRRLGHRCTRGACNAADAIVTTARFAEIVDWRKAPLFSRRRRRGSGRVTPVFTFVHARPQEVWQALGSVRRLVANPQELRMDGTFRGLASTAGDVLRELARRGGPMLALSRVVQAQAKSLRVVLVVGDATPYEAYHFDLVGAHQRTDAHPTRAFCRDLAQRIATTASAQPVDQHRVLDGLIPRRQWETLTTPFAMREAGREFGQRGFFGEMVRVTDLVHVPAVDAVLASQYSEGCFATWEPALEALVVTASGSARPVHKGIVGEDDLAVVAGLRADERGALVRHVEGKTNPTPSVESVELAGIDQALPTIVRCLDGESLHTVPVIRSKLHGHRGIAAYDPRRVEYAPLPRPAQRHLPSCGTDHEYRAVRAAFARAETLRRPEDPRVAAFTILPGHGVIVAEKWSSGAAPFQMICELVDDRRLVFENAVPQGPLRYVARTPRERVVELG